MPTAAPWYRQFWPRFLLALPLAVVIAGFATLYIAMRHADSPVRDDYVKEGLILRRADGQDQAAARLGLGARLSIGTEYQVALTLTGALDNTPPVLELQFIHALDSANDFTVALARSGAGYAGVLPRPLTGHWTVELHAPAAPWRLRGELTAASGVATSGVATTTTITLGTAP